MATAARLASRVLPSRVLPSRPTRSRRSRLAARAASSSPDDDPSPPRPAYDRAVHAIVIGGSSGMGKAAALECVKRGGSVLIASRSRAKLERARAELASTLGLDLDEAAARVALDVVDASDEASVEAFFSRVAPGEYNALIVSAADRAVHGAFLDLPTSSVREFVDSKFWGAYHCAKHGAPALADGGAVVLFSGVLGRRPGVNCSPLAICNGAVEALARTLALELGPRLRVNAFSPGFVDTERFDHMDPERREAMLESTGRSLPLRRVGEAADAGLALHFLAQSAYTTGTVLDCDGGHQVRQYADAGGDPMRRAQKD